MNILCTLSMYERALLGTLGVKLSYGSVNVDSKLEFSNPRKAI